MVKIAICDDETEFLDLLSDSLDSWCRAHQLTLQLYRFTNGDELISAHRAYGMDLILLDMIMPLLSGMDTARELRQHDPHVPIIFLTSSPEFALESYEVRTFWYLLKPLDEVRFNAVLDSWYEVHKASMAHFAARTDSGYQSIYFQDVEYLEAQNKNVLVTLKDGSVISIKEPFHQCETIFTVEKGFYKCHRSCIAALSCVEKFGKTSLFTKSGAQIPISRDNYANFKDVYFSYMFPQE